MSGAIPEKYRDLFSKRAFASLGTLMPDGRPQVTPVWCDLEGELVIFNSAKGRQKDRNVRRDPRVAIAIVDPENPYRYLEIRGQRGRDHRAGRRRAHRQDGEEISRRRQISLPAARRSAGDLQDSARAHHHDGLIAVAPGAAV